MSAAVVGGGSGLPEKGPNVSRLSGFTEFPGAVTYVAAPFLTVTQIHIGMWQYP